MKLSCIYKMFNSILIVFLHTNQLFELGSWWNDCNINSVSIAIKMANPTYTETPTHAQTCLLTYTKMQVGMRAHSYIQTCIYIH